MNSLVFLRSPLVPVFWPSRGLVGTTLIGTCYQALMFVVLGRRRVFVLCVGVRRCANKRDAPSKSCLCGARRCWHVDALACDPNCWSRRGGWRTTARERKLLGRQRSQIEQARSAQVGLCPSPPANETTLTSVVAAMATIFRLLVAARPRRGAIARGAERAGSLREEEAMERCARARCVCVWCV
jgi:hypothetical protein